MKCPFCKKEIPDGARKCEHCSEYLGFFGWLKRFTGQATAILAVFVSIASLSYGLIQQLDRNQAVEEKEVAQEQAEEAVAEKEAAVVEARATEQAAGLALAELNRDQLEHVARATFKTDHEVMSLMGSNPTAARRTLESRLEMNPSDVKARTGLLLLDAGGK